MSRGVRDRGILEFVADNFTVDMCSRSQQTKDSVSSRRYWAVRSGNTLLTGAMHRQPSRKVRRLQQIACGSEELAARRFFPTAYAVGYQLASFGLRLRSHYRQ